MVGQLDQAAEMHLAADEALPGLVGLLPETGQPGGIALTQPGGNVGKLHRNGQKACSNSFSPLYDGSLLGGTGVEGLFRRQAQRT